MGNRQETVIKVRRINPGSKAQHVRLKDMRPLGSLKFALFFAVAMPALPEVAAAQEAACPLPRLQTNGGCIYPELLGLHLALGEPLRGQATLHPIEPEEIGRAAPPEGQGYFRLAASRMILLVEVENYVVMDIFTDPRNDQ
ncbi:hypothetical protein [Pontivivens ytuae]|uniref:Uncharacterized protein n=1 Tax=Pontivivens ytuae TaxID=2789856 RepID=A0A7S9QC75_9RHOB|nr:hypothetical protein [Pontivivens ytuae]QPH53525.1 hypothetical protein I0K15_17340 [Pontivivens ytuae]